MKKIKNPQKPVSAELIIEDPADMHVQVAAAARQSPPNFVLRDPETARIWPTEGFVLITGVATLQFHPEIWPRPTEFLPERWIAGEGDALYSGPNSKYAWRPFEWGPMSCIGQELALMELKMALLFVVRELEFETALEEWDRLRCVTVSLVSPRESWC